MRCTSARPAPLRLLFADGSAEPVLEALRGYRNGDGGFGHALEPDLRCPTSQPAPTLHALGVLNEAGAAGSEMARDARAWIVSIAREMAASHSCWPASRTTRTRRGGRRSLVRS